MNNIVFAKTFPVGHPRAGQKTNFAKLIDTDIKLTTIRGGHNWKPGDAFEGKQWTGLPRRSKQKSLGPFMVTYTLPFYKKRGIFYLNGSSITLPTLARIAYHDGLPIDDFCAWFGEDTFDGQMIFFTPLPFDKHRNIQTVAYMKHLTDHHHERLAIKTIERIQDLKDIFNTNQQNYYAPNLANLV